MDDGTRIIDNLRDVVGFTNLRTFTDLGHMKLATVEKRLNKVENKIRTRSVISIFIAWLQARAMQVRLAALPIQEWCNYMVLRCGCSRSRILWFWDRSETAVWCHFISSSLVPDVRCLMVDVCRAVWQVFPLAYDDAGDGGDYSPAQRCYGSSWRPSDEPRGWPRTYATRREYRGGDHYDPRSEPMGTPRADATLRRGHRLDISSGRSSDKTDCGTRNTSLARSWSLDTKFARPRCNESGM